MNYKRVAVLRGGPSEEYSVSMQSGKAVLNALKQLNFSYKDIVVTKKGEWLESGFIKTPESALKAVDVIFIALHGQYGEDGQIQRILERSKIPFTGSKAMPSAIAFNKDLAKLTLRSHNIKMPRHRRVSRHELVNIDEEIENIFLEIGKELFIKPVSNGSSLGAKFIPNKDSLKSSLSEILEQYEQVMVEEYIRGREATVGVLENFRNEKTYVLPAIEIVPPGGEPLFSHENKYNGKTNEIVPGRFSYNEKATLAEMASLAHRVIGCRHYSRSDFIIRENEVFFLEINTLPGLTEESLFPKAAAAVGVDFPLLINHLIKNAHL